MTAREESYDVVVESVTETDRTFLDASGNKQERTVHKIVAKKTDGVKLTLQDAEALPWRIGDPLTVRVSTDQSHLDEYQTPEPEQEEEKPAAEEGKE